MAKRVVDVLVPVALDQAYSYRVPDGLELAPGDCRQRAARRARRRPAWCGPKRDAQSAARQSPQGRRRTSSTCRRCKPELREFVDWVANYTLARAAWCCACACAWASISAPSAMRIGVRLAGPPPQAHDAGAQRACWRCSPTGCCAASATRRRSRRQLGVIDGTGRRGHAGSAGAAARAGRAAARSGLSPCPNLTPAQQRGRRRAARDASARGGFSVDAARRRHRLGQDRGLFRGGRRERSGAGGRR